MAMVECFVLSNSIISYPVLVISFGEKIFISPKRFQPINLRTKHNENNLRLFMLNFVKSIFEKKNQKQFKNNKVKLLLRIVLSTCSEVSSCRSYRQQDSSLDH